MATVKTNKISISSELTSSDGYVKFPDGTLIAWVNYAFTGQNVTGSSGSLYYSNNQLTLPNWPTAFYSAPTVFTSISGGFDLFPGRVTGTSATTAGKLYVYSAVSLSNKDFTVNAVGIGRWKA